MIDSVWGLTVNSGERENVDNKKIKRTVSVCVDSIEYNSETKYEVSQYRKMC